MGSSTPVLSAPDKKTRGRSSDSGRAGNHKGPSPASVPRTEPLLVRLRSHSTAVTAVTSIVVLTVLAIFAPLLSPYAGDAVEFSRANLPPSLQHPFGTDDLGRDLFYRVMLGGRVTLAAGLVAALIAVALGALLGAVAGYRGGWFDTLIMRITDLALSVPAFFIVLLLATLLTPGFLVICLIIAMTQWMEVARVSRSVVLTVKQNEFIDAARALGVPEWRILLRHVLGHTGAPVLISATVAVAQAVMTESALSFLGFGVQPPAASWGLLLQNAQSHLATAPWMALFPGLMIFVLVLSFYTLGDCLRSTLDPRTSVKP